jgi:cold shock CspA family protein
MEIPLEVKFKDGPNPPWVEDLVRRRVDKLEQFCDHIIRCRVAIERPNGHPDTGNPYRVMIDLTVPPGHEVVVDRQPREGGPKRQLRTVLIDAFEAAERQLKELVERQRGEVKTHDEPVAFVVRKFDDQGYGFLKTPDGREVYFHQNAVLDHDFERLEVGTQVRFEEAMGEAGPQATSVRIIDKPGHAPTAGEAVEPPAGW